jgi:hypothetical protein
MAGLEEEACNQLMIENANDDDARKYARSDI